MYGSSDYTLRVTVSGDLDISGERQGKMPPHGITEKMQPTAPFDFNSNPFSILDALPASPPPPEPPAPQPQPQSQPNPKPSSRRLSINKLIRISATFSTTSSRVLSFQEWPHTNISPQQLARFGFYHRPSDKTPDSVCCFICEAELSGWDPVGPYTAEDLLEQHGEDCLWADMLRDVQPCLENASPKAQSVTNAPSPATNIPSDITKPVNTQPAQGFNSAA
jgi:hypothetical protein